MRRVLVPGLVVLVALLLLMPKISAVPLDSGQPTAVKHSKTEGYLRRKAGDLAPEHQVLESWQEVDRNGNLVRTASRTTAGDGTLLLSGGHDKSKLRLTDHIHRTEQTLDVPKSYPKREDTFNQGIRSGNIKLSGETQFNSRRALQYESLEPITERHLRWTAPYIADLKPKFLKTITVIDPETNVPIRVEQRAVLPDGSEVLVGSYEEVVYETLPVSSYPVELFN